MANEAVVIELWGQPKGEVVRFSCTDNIAIAKGTICVLSGATVKMVKPSSAEGEIFAGIAATEKVSGDGQTTIGLWTKGIFDLKSGDDALVIGQTVKVSGANLIGKAAPVTAGVQEAFGKTIEAGAASEVIQVMIGGY